MHDLDGDLTVEPQVEGCIYGRHATSVNDPSELISTIDYFTGEISHG
jgi:hypothetical protein